ncbi:hypothetical protein BXO88_15680 [Oribacterium sp. C9]|uniref:excisionase n=1 Tax=Oribacterium sp. C9 TaxID=1943579 RepID=UPI00098F94BB|nr:excisionase [Oribacterium sp. C9]OON84758.1 hypothetical protein BXO88_15680 [Oribacterium sp. C9]
MQEHGNKSEVPIWHKVNLTIIEAAEYSNIGINRIEELLKQPICPFLLYVGRKRLARRTEFEEYLGNAVGLKMSGFLTVY